MSHVSSVVKNRRRPNVSERNVNNEHASHRQRHASRAALRRLPVCRQACAHTLLNFVSETKNKKKNIQYRCQARHFASSLQSRQIAMRFVRATKQQSRATVSTIQISRQRERRRARQATRNNHSTRHTIGRRIAKPAASRIATARSQTLRHWPTIDIAAVV
jgi:hypothetical protein